MTDNAKRVVSGLERIENWLVGSQSDFRYIKKIITDHLKKEKPLDYEIKEYDEHKEVILRGEFEIESE